MSTQELIDLADRFDSGDQSVTMDQYDDAIEQLSDLAENGNEAAQGYLATSW